MDMYLIHLDGQGDTTIKIVSKETFEWVDSSDMGYTGGELGWLDRTCPLNVRKKIWENYTESEKEELEPFEEFYPEITYGSPNNDRALYAPAEVVDGKVLFFHDISSYTKYVVENKVNIIDEYEGYIY